MIVSVLVLAFILIAIYVGSHKLSGLQAAGVILVFVVGVILVVFPTLAGIVAWHLGVGRGTDLILYFSVVAGLFVVANFYFRMKAQEDMIVSMAREIALLAPSEPRRTAAATRRFSAKGIRPRRAPDRTRRSAPRRRRTARATAVRSTSRRDAGGRAAATRGRREGRAAGVA